MYQSVSTNVVAFSDVTGIEIPATYTIAKEVILQEFWTRLIMFYQSKIK